MEAHAGLAPNEEEFNLQKDTLERIVASVRFFPFASSSFQWDEGWGNSIPFKGIDSYSFEELPEGWQAAETGTSVVFSSPSSAPFDAGKIEIVFEPWQDDSLWESAEPIIGEMKLRMVPGSRVEVDDTVTVQYMVKNDWFTPGRPYLPSRATVTMPVLDGRSEAWRLYEETVVRILAGADVVFSGPSYP